jgi:hypothetical protein
MAGKIHANKYVVERVIQKGWEYLDKNFGSFTTTQKISVALELCKKSMPQQHEHSGEISVVVEKLKASRNRIADAVSAN